MASRQPRMAFSEADDLLLAKFIAKYNPSPAGRMGNTLYKKLTDNIENKWKWSSHHSWQSWRERYKNRQPWFDTQIARLHKKYGPKLEFFQSKASGSQPAVRSPGASGDRDVEGTGTKRKRELTEERHMERKKAKAEAEEVHVNQQDNTTRRRGPASKIVKSEEMKGDEDEDEDERHTVAHAAMVDEDDNEARRADEKRTSSTENSEDEDVTKPSKLPRDTSRSQAPAPSTHPPSTPFRFADGSIYPDISTVPSPHSSQPEKPQITGAYDTAVKEEPLTEEKLALQAFGLTQSSHPPQEPTPPLSNVDPRSPQPQDIKMIETGDVEVEALQPERKPVFPGGNYRMGLPVRTDTLTIPSSPAGSGYLSGSTSPKRKPKRRQSSGQADFFDSLPPSPGPPDVILPKAPLRFVEGPFGSAFTDGKRKPRPSLEHTDSQSEDEDEDTDDDGDEEDEVNRVVQEWPPQRHVQRQVDIKGKQKATDKPIVHLVKSEITIHHPFSQPTLAHLALRQTDNNAEGSSSARPEEPSRHPFSPPKGALEMRDIVEGKRSKPRVDIRAFVDSLPDPSTRKRSSSYAESSRSDSGAGKAYVPSNELLAAVATIRAPRQSNSAKAPTHNPLVQDTKAFKFPLPHDRSLDSSSDPFLVPALPRPVSDLRGKQRTKLEQEKHDRRKTFGGIGSHPAIPDIDLTMRMNRPHRRIFSLSRQSLSGPSSSAAVHSSLPSRRVSAPAVGMSPSFSPFNMSASDAELAMSIGRAALIKRMSENRRFTEDTITRVWQEEGSFELADARLKEMWESAQATFEAGRKSNRLANINIRREPSPPRRTSEHVGLVYTPVPAGGGHLSDYSPPQITRAAQYRQALRRSGGSIDLSPLRNQRRFSPAASPAARSGVGSQSSEPSGFNDEQLGTASPPSAQPVWGEEEDRMLLSGDGPTLKKLEARVGKMYFRRRIAQLLT